VSGRLAGRVAIVTGAASGIGRAVARAYAAEGAAVFATDVAAAALAAVAEPIGAVALAGDVRDPDCARRVADAALAAYGRIDVLANIAGVLIFKAIDAMTVEDWDRILDVNLKGSFLFCRAVAPAMKAARQGAIINTSSNAGVRGGVDETAYCASKFGVEGLSRALALELGPHGIAVNSCPPGHPVHTAMSETTYDAEKRRIWKDPSEIAPAYVELALATPAGIHDRHVRAWDLLEELRGRRTAAT